MKKIIFALFFVFTLQVSYTQWVAQNIPGNLYFLNGIDFYNAQTGAVGGWVGTFSPEGYPQNLSEMNGFSQLGRALYTTNGGINWNYSVIPDSLRILSALQYIDQQLVYGFASKNVTASATFEKLHNNRFRNISFSTGSLRSLRDNRFEVNGGGVSRGYLLRSTNSGQSWQYYSAMPPGVIRLNDGVFVNSSTGYASAVTEGSVYNVSGILRSTNSGLNWNFVSPADSFQNYNSMEFPNASTGFAVGEHLDTNAPVFSGLILRTTNGGTNWSRTKIPAINNFQGVSFSNATTGIAIGTSNDNIPGAHFYKTTNAGATWFKLPFQEDTSFADGINMVAGTGRGFAFGEKFKADPLQPGTFIAKGLFINRTTDYGQTWHKSFIVDTEGIFINSADIDQNTWYISGGNFFTEKGIVLKTTNGGGPIGINPISSEVPVKFNVYQNYPNPFNPVTKIKFDLSKSGDVSFKVFDILGRLVYEIGENKPAGIYEITFDAGAFSSGIYYYRVETGSFSETRKMVLLK